MLDYILQNPQKAEEGLRNKGVDVDINKVLELNKKYKDTLKKVEELRAQKNEVSKKISKLNKEERKIEFKRAEALKSKLQKQEKEFNEIGKKLNKILNSLPNISFDEVPRGKDENENVVLRKVGKLPSFSFDAKDYLELALNHDLVDVERAGKVSGSRFGYLKNQAVQLEFALVNFATNLLIKEGFSLVVPPVLIKSEYMRKLGYLEKDPDDLYWLEKDNLYLVGTSEQSVVPMYADEILKGEELPKRFVAFSSCFRREAGSYGKDTKGILRVHQFDKVEMISFCRPEKSREEHKYLLSLQEKLMQELKLPYQVVHISTGDMGFSAAEQFDIETWIPSESKYRETHSTSNTTDFQARRLNIRYKLGEEKGFMHILNGTAFAVGRMLIAILENYQTKDGEIEVPKALQKYIGLKKLS